MPGTDARRRVATSALFLFLAAAPAAHAAAGDLDLVSRASGASGTSGNGSSSQPAPSADGHLIAFQSAAKNLTADSPQDGTGEAYVRDMNANTIALVSRAGGAAGAAANAGVTDVGMSDNGRYVVFHTRATNLGPTVAGVDRVFLRDTQANTTTLVAEGALRPAISADGSTVAYGAQSSGSQKIFAYSVQSGQATVVSIGLNGLPMTGDNPALSADGQVVAFSGQGGTSQVWARDRAAGTTALVSRASGTDGAQASAAATGPDISANGRYVVFSSTAPNLSDDDAQTTDDVFERDLQANTTTLVSRADGATGAASDAGSDSPSVSDDGTRVFFKSRGTNLSSEDNSGGDNGFVRDTVTGTTTWVHGAEHQSPAPQGVMDGLALSGDGRYAVFASGATLLPAQESGSFGDVFRRDLGGPPPPPPLPSASIGGDQAVDEGGFGAVTPVGFTVTLSAADARAIQIDWQTVASTAAAGSDYRGASGQVTFAPGQTEAFISVDVLGDTTDEPDEAFSVALSNPVNVMLGRSVATVTIRDDDLPAPPPGGGTFVPPPPPGLGATSGAPATTCATQTTQGLAVLRGCIANGRMTGVVSVNGLTVDLGGNALVVEATRIASTGAVTISAGDVVINRGVNFNLDPKTGLASLTAPSGSSLYGLTLEPKLALRLASGGVANVDGQVALLGVPVPVSFQASDADGLRRNTIKAAASVVDFKRFVALSLALQFDPGALLWRGGFTGKSVFPGIPQLTLAGTIDRSGTITFGGKPPSLGGLIKLRMATISLIPSPLSVKGVLGFDAGPFGLFSFDGSATYVLGANTLSLTGTAKIFGLTLGKPGLSGGLGFLGQTFQPSLGGGLLGGVAGGGGGFTFGGSPPLIFGTGAAGQTPPAPATGPLQSLLGGGVGGVIGGLGFNLNPFTNAFSGQGNGTFKVLGVEIGGSATASEKGFAACGDLGFLHFGVGVAYSPFKLTLMGPTTCDVGPWRASASAARAGTRTLSLPAGVQVLRIHSTAPATLHGPGGQTVDTTTAPQVGASAIVLRDDQYTYVALKNPKGTWTADTDGAIDSAAQLAPAKVTVKVAKGRIHWTERVSPGQSVMLAEAGAGVYRELGTLHGPKGTLKLKPQGSGARTIMAIVNEGGVPVSRTVVAHYTAPKPPKPGRPGKIKVAFAKAKLTVSWGAAKHAASYLVKVRTPNGTLFAAPKRRSAKLTDILPVTRATVTVTAVGATGARGPARTVSARPRR